MKLANDIARCDGNDSKVCQNCIRRKPIESDNSFQNHVMAEPINNECDLKIEVTDEADNASSV